MPLLFEPIYTEGLAQISYLVGDTKKGIASVIDPRRDIGVYTKLARSKGVHSAYAIEKHRRRDTPPPASPRTTGARYGAGAWAAGVRSATKLPTCSRKPQASGSAACSDGRPARIRFGNACEPSDETTSGHARSS